MTYKSRIERLQRRIVGQAEKSVVLIYSDDSQEPVPLSAALSAVLGQGAGGWRGKPRHVIAVEPDVSGFFGAILNEEDVCGDWAGDSQSEIRRCD